MVKVKVSDECDGRRSVVSVLARAVCQLAVPVETRQVGGATRLFLLRRELFHRRGPTTLLLSLNQTQLRARWSNLTDRLLSQIRIGIKDREQGAGSRIGIKDRDQRSGSTIMTKHPIVNSVGLCYFLIQVPWKFPAVCEVLMHNKMNEILETGQYCKQNQKHCNSHAKAVLV